jgi:hypothetical protein
LGYGTKTKTAYDFLISKGKVDSLSELMERFSIEVVNKRFYSEIALAFTKLIGGRRENTNYEKELNLYGVTDQNKYAEFAVRLIGRIVFCWFLKEKKSLRAMKRSSLSSGWLHLFLDLSETVCALSCKRCKQLHSTTRQPTHHFIRTNL